MSDNVLEWVRYTLVIFAIYSFTGSGGREVPIVPLMVHRGCSSQAVENCCFPGFVSDDVITGAPKIKVSWKWQISKQASLQPHQILGHCLLFIVSAIVQTMSGKEMYYSISNCFFSFSFVPIIS